MKPKIAVVNISECGESLCPRDHIIAGVKVSHWEKLKDIARRRRYHVNALVKLDGEEQEVRKEIEK